MQEGVRVRRCGVRERSTTLTTVTATQDHVRNAAVVEALKLALNDQRVETDNAYAKARSIGELFVDTVQKAGNTVAQVE